MIVYEFWLKEQFKTQAFEVLCDTFYTIGNIMDRWDNPDLKDEDGKDTGIPCEAPCVYSISRNLHTHWVQLLVDDNTLESIITAIEDRINVLKDGEPIRKYEDDTNNNAPIETPRHFSLDRVLRVRQRQKDGTLGRIEDA